MSAYKVDLKANNKKEFIALREKLDDIDNNLVIKFLKLYLGQCKYKHNFAFLQFRKFLPGAVLSELQENFKVRLENWMAVMKKIKGNMRKGMLDDLYDDKGHADPDEPTSATEEQIRAMSPEIIPLKEKKESTGVDIFIEVKMRMDMNKVDFIDTFEEIGMSNPLDKTSIEFTEEHCSKFEFSQDVYPNMGMMDLVAAAFSNDSVIKQPKVIFLPGRRILRKMIRAMVTLDTSD